MASTALAVKGRGASRGGGDGAWGSSSPESCYIQIRVCCAILQKWLLSSNVAYLVTSFHASLHVLAGANVNALPTSWPRSATDSVTEFKNDGGVIINLYVHH